MNKPADTNFQALLQRLHDHGVDYLIVGGVAAALHGSARLTFDLDIVYRRTADNLAALARALADAAPYPRGAPAGLPFDWSAATLRAGLNFTLSTELGDLDLLGEIAGGGSYEALRAHTLSSEIYGIPCQYLDLPTLIRTKRAAGRPKDLEAIAELEAIWEDNR